MPAKHTAIPIEIHIAGVRLFSVAVASSVVNEWGETELLSLRVASNDKTSHLNDILDEETRAAIVRHIQESQK